MYERFTDRARKVMQLANQEAQRFNHEYIGTEHILLGLIKEGAGISANILNKLGVDLRKVRLEVEKIVQSGPDSVIMGKLPQTPRAKKVIEFAIEEARQRNNNYVGTEHLLLGLLREGEGVAGQVLNQLGVTYDKLKDIPELIGLKLSQDTMNKIALMEAEKDQAICEQNFQRAMELRDAITALKSRAGEPKKEEVTDNHAEHALNLITCNLLLHLVEKKSAQETLADIHKIIHDAF